MKLSSWSAMKSSWSVRIFVIIAFLAMLTKEAKQSELKVVVSKDNLIRLVTSKDSSDIGGGTVQIYHNNEWGTICGKDEWSVQAAKLVCAELGFKTALYPSKNAYFGQGSGPIHLSNVTCPYGNETSIFECRNNGWDNAGSCTHADDAGVRCLKQDAPVLTYGGCWIDNPHDRILKDQYSTYRGGIDWQNLGEIVLNCAKDASGKYNLMAVQYFGECWSQQGNPDYKKMRAAPHACKLGVGEKSHNAVYTFGPLYDLGCWIDRPGQRTMQLLRKRPRRINWLHLEPLVDRCYRIAKENKFKYFGLQFYGECWGSNDDSRYKMHGQATTCYKGLGGSWSNYVYKIRE